MKSSSNNSGISRRQFLAVTGAVLAAPTLIPASALGRGGATAPSERITLGVVGWGMQGPSNTDAFLREKDCQVLTACDLDQNHLQAAMSRINGHYGTSDCKSYKDFREMMARSDIDAVMLAVPDTWHALVAVEAANNKKDIYGEKPLARTIAEQQAIVQAVQKNQRIWQTGSWQRSVANFHKAAEIVRNGMIGKITRVEIGLPEGPHDESMHKHLPGTTPPAELDYDTWIGPSRMVPYIEKCVHAHWRWNYNTGGGQLLDWIGHHCDIAHWGMDCDSSGPLEVEGQGVFPPHDAMWNTCTKYRITAQYPKDIEMVIAGGYDDIKGGTKWIGMDGWVWVSRGNAFESSNPEWADARQLPEQLRKVKLYESSNHIGNFLDCVKSRKPTITPIETAHHSAIPGHLGYIATVVGRKIKWDADKEVIIGDPEASKLLTREFRGPWKLS